MEADQFFRNKKAGIKERKDGYQPVDPGDGDILQTKLTHYFSDHWNVVDFIILVFYLITFVLRIITWKNSTEVSDNRLLAVSGYLYGFIAMLLTLRAFGQVSERVRGMGEIQIALFFVMRDVMTILWQFLATILAFSLAMTKVYVAEKAYTSGKDSAKDLACSESGLICWWTMATHLGWSLLHLANLDAFNSVDGPSVSLIHVLYCFFLIMAVILLANMMIALLSNSYQRVQDNALQEWSFKRAITVRTYSTYHPIPVPFNLLSIPLIALWNLCRKCSCKTSSDSPDSPEGGRREALDKVVKKLQTMYFEKYGYEFPLAEGKKIDHLVQENEGSRKLTNQIVWQVFRPRGNKEEKLASGQSAWYDSPGISVDGCLLTYLGSDFCDTCKRGEPKEIHSAKFKSPFTPETPRFEVLIQETGERRIVALGVVHKSYDCHKMPGWYTGTVGYHVDDGKIFDTGCHKHGREVEGAMAYRGDLIACEVDFGEASKGKITVFFTLNGKEVEHSSMEYTSGKELFPFVSLGFKGITVLTKMCHRDRGRFSRVTNEEIQEEIGTLRSDVQHLLVEQERMFSEMRNLILLSKEVKDKEEQEETT
ncbi:short transient receptor potential channel 2-like [Stylophora pistillata]|uniref:short transient receptor potential channel 2-like n=1 Tax=Stylophora pistillata TaxID=50429 RepID=UPI000C05274C|nr:short transient receptor potential channel 2-like [Stylophora pistillata]